MKVWPVRSSEFSGTPRAPRILMLIVAAAYCIGCAPSAPSADSQPADNSHGSDRQTDAARPLCLIASGDTHGWIIPCGCTSNQSGGLLRRGSYVAAKRKSADVIVVDAGGAADGTAPYQQERFRAILKGEAQMKLVAHNLGAAEIGYSREDLQELSTDTGITFVSANTLTGGRAAAEPSVTVQTAGQTILITGVVSPVFATDTTSVTEPADAILAMLDERTKPYDKLVVLAYLPENELRQLAARIPEADVVIGGPTGQALSPERIGRAMMISATNKGKFLAEVTWSHGELAGAIVEMSPELADSGAQKTNLLEFRTLLKKRDFSAAESGFVEAQTLQPGRHQVAGTQSCIACHEESNTHWTASGHSHAWQRLQSEGAHVDPYCQQCHTTAYGQMGGFLSAVRSPDRTDVGCESCHGPSAAHTMDPSMRTPFDAAGICLKCHDPDNSPHFEYDSYWKKIEHY